MTRTLLVAALLTAASLVTPPGRALLHAATCVGDTPCHACTSCRYCKRCSKDRLTCGTCKRERQLAQQ